MRTRLSARELSVGGKSATGEFKPGGDDGSTSSHESRQSGLREQRVLHREGDGTCGSRASTGSTSGLDGVYPECGGSVGCRADCGGDGVTDDVGSGTERVHAPGVGSSSWFTRIDEDVNECPGGVCPVPWAIDGKDEDLVNHPSHYTQGNIECIEAIEAQLSPEEFRGFLKGNILKYLWRERDKGGIESLKKAGWYLDRLIQLS